MDYDCVAHLIRIFPRTTTFFLAKHVILSYLPGPKSHLLMQPPGSYWFDLYFAVLIQHLSPYWIDPTFTAVDWTPVSAIELAISVVDSAFAGYWFNPPFFDSHVVEPHFLICSSYWTNHNLFHTWSGFYANLFACRSLIEHNFSGVSVYETNLTFLRSRYWFDATFEPLSYLSNHNLDSAVVFYVYSIPRAGNRGLSSVPISREFHMVPLSAFYCKTTAARVQSKARFLKVPGIHTPTTLG
jgi:hypothetical protein